MIDLSIMTFIDIANTMGLRTTDFAFQQPEIQNLIHAKEKIGKFDLLLTEQFYNEGALIWGHLYQIPIITISTFGYANHMSQIVGIMSPWSYVPHHYMSYTDKMSISERIGNVLVSTIEDLQRKFLYYPKHNAILQKYFAALMNKVPTVEELERNISLILLNTHMPLVSPRPTSFNMIHVGGVHILLSKPLPAKIQNFLDQSSHGAIYFSLGSQVRSADLPPETLQIFLDVFGSLRQRVLWKFEDDKIPNLPSNIMIQKWMPQGDILAHPNVKVFIAHGGLFGLQEALYHGVPILGMPVYCDQIPNIKKAIEHGYALSIDYRTVTKEGLHFVLKELLENPKFKTNMKRASKVFRHRPMNAMDTAMFWIDYVIQHRGASHMIASGLDMKWYEFYLLDIIGVFLTIVLLPILTLCCLYCKRSKKNKEQTKG